jgi:hypothetical protein
MNSHEFSRILTISHDFSLFLANSRYGISPASRPSASGLFGLWISGCTAQIVGEF